MMSFFYTHLKRFCDDHEEKLFQTCAYIIRVRHIEKVKYGYTVKLHYLGKLDNGNIFDVTTAEKPLRVVLGSGMQLPAFERSIVGMRVGTMRKFVIPTEDAFGTINKGSLNGNHPLAGKDLTFVVQVLAIV
jgi:FKBP-type peptidyl-prolyl cis-trans isomerase 2